MCSSKVYHVYLARSSPFPDLGPNQFTGWKDRHSLFAYAKPDMFFYSQLFETVKDSTEDRFLQLSLTYKDIKDYTHLVSFYSDSKDFRPTGCVITRLNSSEELAGAITVLKSQENLLLHKQQQEKLRTTKQHVTLVQGAHSKELFCCLCNVIYDYKHNCLYAASHPCTSSDQLNRQALLTEYAVQFLAATVVKPLQNESQQQAKATRSILSPKLASRPKAIAAV